MSAEGSNPAFLVVHHLGLAAECELYADQAAVEGQLVEAEHWLARRTIHMNYADLYERRIP